MTQVIIDATQDRAGVESPQQANELVRAVVTTLSALDLGDQRFAFANELPLEYGEILRRDQSTPEQLNAAEFARRVAAHIDVSPEQADTWSRAVLSLLVESVPTERRQAFVPVLPADLQDYTIWDVA